MVRRVPRNRNDFDICFHLAGLSRIQPSFTNPFETFKSNMILINTARGGIINEDALYEALKNKKIFGAGVDVFKKEPPIENHKLFSLSNTLLTPHNAALTLECRKRMAVESAENIINFLCDREKLNKNNIINREIFNF